MPNVFLLAFAPCKPRHSRALLQTYTFLILKQMQKTTYAFTNHKFKKQTFLDPQ